MYNYFYTITMINSYTVKHDYKHVFNIDFYSVLLEFCIKFIDECLGFTAKFEKCLVLN